MTDHLTLFAVLYMYSQQLIQQDCDSYLLDIPNIDTDLILQLIIGICISYCSVVVE